MIIVFVLIILIIGLLDFVEENVTPNNFLHRHFAIF